MHYMGETERGERVIHRTHCNMARSQPRISLVRSGLQIDWQRDLVQSRYDQCMVTHIANADAVFHSQHSSHGIEGKVAWKSIGQRC